MTWRDLLLRGASLPTTLGGAPVEAPADFVEAVRMLPAATGLEVLASKLGEWAAICESTERGSDRRAIAVEHLVAYAAALLAAHRESLS